MLIRNLWVGVALSVLSAAALTAQPCTGTFKAQLVQDGDGVPLAFASVRLNNSDFRTQTDAEGYFTAPGVCFYQPQSLSIITVYGVLDTILSVVPGTMQLRLPLGGRALSGITISAQAAQRAETAAHCVLDALDVESRQALSLGEVVRQAPGVNVLQTGSNIAKPVIQGLHSNRIAIVNNNVVLESQQWGREHAPETDPFSADKITVVKGAMGVRYGAGAMAGAIVLDPAPLRQKGGWGGWLTSGGFSNGYSGVAAGAVDYCSNSEKWAARIQSSIKRGGNLRAPDYWLYNSGHAEWNVSAMAGWQSSDRLRHEWSFSTVNQRLAILRSSHLGNIEQIEQAIHSPVPLNNIDQFSYLIGRPYQSIRHYTGKYRLVFRQNDHWKWIAQYSYQFNQRREYDVVRKTGNAADKAQVSFRLWTNVLDVHAEHRGHGYWQGETGIQLTQSLNYVNKGAFIPNYLGWGASLWAHERWHRHDSHWEWELGARYDFRWNHVYTTGNTGRDLNQNVQFGNMSGIAGGHYHFNEHTSVTLHSGLAWRPPSVYELYAKGVHHGAGTYEEGDSSLVSEKAVNTNLTLNYAPKWYEGSELNLTLYRNVMLDFIYLDPANTTKITIRGPFPAYYYRQANAVLQGIDGQLKAPVWGHFSAEARVSVLYAFRRTDEGVNDPLPLMPANRYQYGFHWNQEYSHRRPGSFTARLMANTVTRQRHIPLAGLLAPAPAGFTTLALDMNRTFRFEHSRCSQLEAGLTIQNLTNQRYREYLNFFRFYADEPGINVGVRLKVVF